MVPRRSRAVNVNDAKKKKTTKKEMRPATRTISSVRCCPFAILIRTDERGKRKNNNVVVNEIAAVHSQDCQAYH